MLTIQIEQANVLTLPASAVATRGNVNEGYQDFCFLVRDGKTWRTPVEVGIRGEGRLQVLKKHIDGAWHDFNSDDQFVHGELATLADGQEVTVVANQDIVSDHDRGTVPYRTKEGRGPTVVRFASPRPIAHGFGGLDGQQNCVA